MFVNYVNRESDDVINCSTKNSKRISWSIKAVFFKLGTINIYQKNKAQDGTRCAVVMTSLLDPVSFSYKPNISICKLNTGPGCSYNLNSLREPVGNAPP